MSRRLEQTHLSRRLEQTQFIPNEPPNVTGFPNQLKGKKERLVKLKRTPKMLSKSKSSTGNMQEIPDWPYDDCYNFNYPRRGLAIIFTMGKFKSPFAAPRPSAETDLQSMTNTFENLGFRVKPYHNKTTKVMRQKLKKASRYNHSHADCFVCVISTHGKEVKRVDMSKKWVHKEHYLSTKDGEIGTAEVLSYFREESCHSLKDKPKLFFIQACRSNGKGRDMGQEIGEWQNIDPSSKDQKGNDHKIPNTSDNIETPEFNSDPEDDGTNSSVTDGNAPTEGIDCEQDWDDISDDEYIFPPNDPGSSEVEPEEAMPDTADSVPGNLNDFHLEDVPVPCHKNMLVMLAVPSGYETFSRSTGGWLILALKEQFKNYMTLEKVHPRQLEPLNDPEMRETTELLTLLAGASNEVATQMISNTYDSKKHKVIPASHKNKTALQIIHRLTRDPVGYSTNDCSAPPCRNMSSDDTTDAKPFGKGPGQGLPGYSGEGDHPMLSKKEFYADEYKMDYPKRGKALIINNKSFDQRLGLGERTGTDADAFALYSRFTELGFDVEKHNNLSEHQMRYIMLTTSKEDHSNADCFACAILSHGEEGHVFGTDAKVEIKSLLDNFKGNRCKTLVGKPKLFFIQACQGQQFDDGTDMNVADAKGTPGPTFMDVDNITVHSIPSEADFLIAYSVVPGFYSWRNSSRGSWFVQALSQVLEECSENTDLLKMMTRVNKKVAIDFHSNTSKEFMNRKKQIPCINSMLTRDLYFKPKP
ncbi:hypothetical protein ScPMuIL_004570 [Solemya velum]